MRRIASLFALTLAISMMVGCGRSLRWVSRTDAGGALQVNGDYSRLRPKADRLMARQCRDVPYQVVSEPQVPPDQRVRGHVIQFQCMSPMAQPMPQQPMAQPAQPQGEPHDPYAGYGQSQQYPAQETEETSGGGYP